MISHDRFDSTITILRPEEWQYRLQHKKEKKRSKIKKKRKNRTRDLRFTVSDLNLVRLLLCVLEADFNWPITYTPFFFSSTHEWWNHPVEFPTRPSQKPFSPTYNTAIRPNNDHGFLVSEKISQAPYRGSDHSTKTISIIALKVPLNYNYNKNKTIVSCRHWNSQNDDRQTGNTCTPIEIVCLVLAPYSA